MARPSLDEIFGEMPDGVRPLTNIERKKAEADQYMKNIGAGIVGAADVASMGFGDEMIAGLQSWPAYLSKDVDFADLYAKNLAEGRADIAQTKEQSPNAFLAGQLAGAIGTGVAGAGTKGGAALANSLRSGNVLGYNLGLAGRAAKAGALGAATSGVAGFGAGEGIENRLESSGDSAVAGGVLGSAFPVAGAVAGKVASGIKAIPDEVKHLIPATPKSVKQLRDAAKPLYEKFTNSGGVYSDKLTNEIADLAEAVKIKGINGQLKPEDAQFNTVLDYYSRLRGAKLSPSQLQELDQSFADDIARLNAKGEYNFGRILNNLKYEMRSKAFAPEKAVDYIESGSAGSVEALKEANRLYAQSYKAADIEKILQKSKGTQVPQNSIRTGIKNLLANDKKMANYTAAEKAALEEAMKRGYVGGLINLFGGRATDAVAGGVAGFTAGGPVGAIAGTVAGKAVGGVAADAAGAIQANRLRGALENIQEGTTQAAKGGLPALVSSKSSGQLAVPVGAVIGAQTPTQQMQTPMPPANRQSLDEIFGEQPTATTIEPLSYNQEVPTLNQRIAEAESGGNTNAKNPDSSASGLYQFTDSTWRSAVDKWGRARGIKYTDKNNPQAQELLMSKLIEDNARILRNKGIEPSDANIYFAHFMGAPAASKAISMLGKKAIAARSFPQAAMANKAVFFDGKRPRTIDEVYKIITSKVV